MRRKVTVFTPGKQYSGEVVIFPMMSYGPPTYLTALISTGEILGEKVLTIPC